MLTAKMSRHGTLDILIVEDDDDTSRMLSILLRRGGHRALRCGELETASTVLSTRCFHLALIDLSLPDGTGVQAAHIARARVPKPYLVALTGWAAGPLREAADVVFDDVILKPILPVRLDAVLQAAWHASAIPAA